MNKHKSILIVCVLFIVAIGFYFIGYKVAYNRIESANINDEQTFYATITAIDNLYFGVQGLSVNDINYRGEFRFTVIDETKMEWRGTVLSASDFDIGDTVSITFSGEIQETYPAAISKVNKIQLLDDEK